MEIGLSAGKSFAYLLGVYLGDGCTSKSWGALLYRVNTIDPDFAEAIASALKNMGAAKVNICTYPVKKSSKPNIGLACRHDELCAHLIDITRSKTIIPADVFSWPKDWRLEFIGGLMDSEGFVAKKTGEDTGRSFYMGFKSCDVWVPEFVRLLQEIGIKVGTVSQCPPYKEGYKVPTRFTIKMQSWVDSGAKFKIARKQERVDRWAVTVPYTERSRFPRRLTSETTRQPA